MVKRVDTFDNHDAWLQLVSIDNACQANSDILLSIVILRV